VIHQVIAGWHEVVRSGSVDRLDALLADDVVFYSPIVYSPQRGRQITKVYLQAALQTLPGDVTADDASPFRYTKQVVDGDTAVLEFETSVDGKYVNGVDVIRCDSAGQIVEFRVMLRPLQAVNVVHARMRALLEAEQR
jgi:ketosteroid isomerase-like protein